jgi:hypothetical protein
VFLFPTIVRKGYTYEMSRGPGRIERIITGAMFANPSAIFTIPDLVALAYPDAEPVMGIVHHRWRGYIERGYIEKRYRSAILRAAKKAVPRAGWDVMKAQAPGGPPVFFNPCDLRSYACARLRTVYGHYHRADVSDPERLGEAHYRNLLEPETGSWWREVEAAKLRRNGKIAEAEALDREQKQDIAALLKRAEQRIAAAL